MTQDALFLLLVSLIGVYATRWTLRLAPLRTELPGKTLIATALAGLVFITSFTVFDASRALWWGAMVLAPLFVFAPFALVVLTRAGRHRLAVALIPILYWTTEGRAALRRLLAQAALQRGAAAAALELAGPDDELIRAQAFALSGAWSSVLELDLPEEGDNAFLAYDARVESLLALGRDGEARLLVGRMRQLWEAGAKGPIAFRCLTLSQARIDAEDGAFEKVRQALSQPMAGMRPAAVYAVLGRAAERAGHADVASNLYTRAFEMAPVASRERYAERLRLLGAGTPDVPKRRGAAIATLALAGGLVLIYVVQLLSSRIWGDVMVLGQRMEIASYAGAFVLNVPGVAAAEAWWRYLSYGLLHANLLHIGFNLWVLVDLGRIYEARRGWGDLLAAFVAGTAMGAYLSSVAQAGQSVVLVGASGGILGIAGALLADAMRSRAPADRALLRGLVQWIVLIFLFSVAVPQVSLWGHAGGVVGGLLWGFLRQGLPGRRIGDRMAGALAVALLVIAAAAAVWNAVSTLS